MDKIEIYEDALELLKRGETLVSSSFGGPVTFYSLGDGYVLYKNEQLHAKMTLKDFHEDFFKGAFYLYEMKKDEIEIDQHDPYWRQ